PGRARRTILVVEDDAAVRLASAETIGELGYRTVTAADGAAALAVLDGEREVAVLFTDVVMPGIDGPTLAAEARRRRPDLKVVFATGHPAGDEQEGPRPGPGETVLRKPFSIEDLAEALEVASREQASA
ncbi:histidine kinase, partial [Methylobacterium indicum]